MSQHPAIRPRHHTTTRPQALRTSAESTALASRFQPEAPSRPSPSIMCSSPGSTVPPHRGSCWRSIPVQLPSCAARQIRSSCRTTAMVGSMASRSPTRWRVSNCCIANPNEFVILVVCLLPTPPFGCCSRAVRYPSLDNLHRDGYRAAMVLSAATVQHPYPSAFHAGNCTEQSWFCRPSQPNIHPSTVYAETCMYRANLARHTGKHWRHHWTDSNPSSAYPKCTVQSSGSGHGELRSAPDKKRPRRVGQTTDGRLFLFQVNEDDVGGCVRFGGDTGARTQSFAVPGFVSRYVGRELNASGMSPQPAEVSPAGEGEGGAEPMPRTPAAGSARSKS